MWLRIIVAVVIVGPGLARGEDWPGWRGPRGDGTWHAPPLADRWPATGLQPLWEVPIGGGYAGVTVADGRVFVMDRQTSPAEVERVLCYEAATGKLLWKHEYAVKYGDLDYGTGPRAAVTCHQDKIFTLGAVGHAWCLEAATGRPIWSLDFVQERGAVLPTWGLAASPVIFEDRVILHAGAQPGGCLTAHEVATGRELWRCSADGAGYATPILVARAAGNLLVGWTPENIIGVAPATGELLWSEPYKVTYGVSIATPICQQDLVFVAGYWEGSKAIRLGARLADAELAWEENRYLRGLMSQPLYRDGYVYLLDKQHGLTCFELATGTMRWNEMQHDTRLTPRGRNPQASLVWLGESPRALVLNSEGELLLVELRPNGYTELARSKIIDATWAHPAFAGRHVYARSDTRLVCVELP